MQVVDDVLRRQVVHEANEEREAGVEEEVVPDVEQQPGLGQVLDVRVPVLDT